MSTRSVQWIAIGSGALALVTWLAVVPFDVQGPVRAILGLAFAMVSPGYCILLAGGVREVSTLTLMGTALSLSVGGLLTVLLMFLRMWSVEAAVSILAVTTGLLAVVLYRQTERLLAPR